MKATDLMIGDWVLLDKNAWIDDEYDRRCGVPDYQPHKIESGEDLDESVNADGGALPIPLTPEILEKNGYKITAVGDNGVSTPAKNRNRWEKWECHTQWQDFNIFYDRLKKSYSLNFYGNHIEGVKIVHELQHALRLCGFEKEIVL